jgi:dynactin complex subunit
MEPLAEENQKLKEAINLSERHPEGRRERDLAESNAWDLEHQKGVLSEQLATTKEKLRSKSEQLATASTQLKDASKHLEQL